MKSLFFTLLALSFTPTFADELKKDTDPNSYSGPIMVVKEKDHTPIIVYHLPAYSAEAYSAYNPYSLRSAPLVFDEVEQAKQKKMAAALEEGTYICQVQGHWTEHHESESAVDQEASQQALGWHWHYYGYSMYPWNSLNDHLEQDFSVKVIRDCKKHE